MTILERCQKWYEAQQYKKIIDELEAIEDSKKTPEIDCELARAYNNEANPDTSEGRGMLNRAIELLKRHEEALKEDFIWNYRLGYAYYFLQQEGRALEHFLRAQKASPQDEHTKKFVARCMNELCLPEFKEYFSDRVSKAWEIFASEESELRQIMDEDKEHKLGKELVSRIEKILNIALSSVAFEFGFNSTQSKYELILSPEGERLKLFELLYFKNHAPKSVLDHWNILVGRQSSPEAGLWVDGDVSVNGQDVLVWLTPEEKEYRLDVYCEKLLDLKKENEDWIWWILTNLTDQILGEIAHMSYISDFVLLDKPKDEPAILLSNLPKKLKDLGCNLAIDAQGLLDKSYIGYSAKPDKDSNADWRLDIIAGSTCCPPLINGYMSADDEVMDKMHADGIVAGFLIYPLDGFSKDNYSKEVFEFRDKLEEYLNEVCGPDSITLLGGATGISYGYIDFIAWNIRKVLVKAKEFFENTSIKWASFHTFRRKVGTVPLKTEKEALLSENLVFKYSKENSEGFYETLKKLNEKDEYTKCIQLLEDVPQEFRDYRWAYALARALENYAIIGDHDEGTSIKEGDKALQKAIVVLESVREEGQNKAEWNMRMAYAYQYLCGQEEKAIEYAKLWAKLDPEDKDAEGVIKECEEEIAKRNSGLTIQPKTNDSFDEAKMLDNEHSQKQAEVLEMYSEDEMKAIEEHIQKYFGNFENVFHEIVSSDIHIDICIVPPSEDRDYYTFVTMGMGAHVMNVPKEFSEYKVNRAELAISLPKDWKVSLDDFKDENWYWPIRLLKQLARLPILNDTWLSFGHSMDNEENFSQNTELCAALLISPQVAEESARVCTLPNGENVNFYHVIPLYRDELEFKLENGTEALLKKMRGISFVVNPSRPNALKRGSLAQADEFVDVMDDVHWHLESIEEKKLKVDEICAYNHLAYYLRWCIEHDLMSDDFVAKYGYVINKIKNSPSSLDLRGFIRDELKGVLSTELFNEPGRYFASYYYGEADSPYYPSDIDNYSISFIGQERNYSEEIQDEAYLFVPFNEKTYQDISSVIDSRFKNYTGQHFDESTLEPNEVAQALMEYLECECTYFPSMADDDPIMSAYSYAKRDCVHDGFIPLLIRADDETLLESLVLNSDPENEKDLYEFDAKTVAQYRKTLLAQPIKDVANFLDKKLSERKSDAKEDGLDWEEDVIGKISGGFDNYRISSYWNSETDMTYPVILAKIPVKNPWEVFAYLPFGNWNDCPDTDELMAISKYWFEKFGAIPCAITHDELEFLLEKPIEKQDAIEVAEQHYAFCSDIIDQGPIEATVGALADELTQSTVWYFWWD